MLNQSYCHPWHRWHWSLSLQPCFDGIRCLSPGPSNDLFISGTCCLPIKWVSRKKSSQHLHLISVLVRVLWNVTWSMGNKSTYEIIAYWPSAFSLDCPLVCKKMVLFLFCLLLGGVKTTTTSSYWCLACFISLYLIISFPYLLRPQTTYLHI